MTGTVEFIQRITYVEIQDEKGEMQTYALPETAEDVQELVRCSKCKHNTSTIHNPVCELDVYRSGGMDWFCADGERKDT